MSLFRKLCTLSSESKHWLMETGRRLIWNWKVCTSFYSTEQLLPYLWITKAILIETWFLDLDDMLKANAQTLDFIVAGAQNESFQHLGSFSVHDERNWHVAFPRCSISTSNRWQTQAEIMCLKKWLNTSGKMFCSSNWDDSGWKKVLPGLPEAQNTHIQINAFMENDSMFEEGNTRPKARVKINKKIKNKKAGVTEESAR